MIIEYHSTYAHTCRVTPLEINYSLVFDTFVLVSITNIRSGQRIEGSLHIPLFSLIQPINVYCQVKKNMKLKTLLNARLGWIYLAFFTFFKSFVNSYSFFFFFFINYTICYWISWQVQLHNKNTWTLMFQDNISYILMIHALLIEPRDINDSPYHKNSSR